MAAPISSSLPFYLFPGHVAIYGKGTIQGNYGAGGAIPTEQVFLFGYIYATGGDVFSQIGDSVLFKQGTQLCTLLVNNWPYTIIEEARLAITEKTPIST